MTEVDPFSMIDEIPARQPDVIQELPFPWGRLVIGVIVGLLLTPWLAGALSWVKHHVGPAINAYGDWAYRLAGGQ